MHPRLPALLMLCVLSLGGASFAADAPAAPATGAAAAGEQAAVRFPNFGMSVVTPPGWMMEGTPPAGGIARWTKREGNAPTGKVVAEMAATWVVSQNKPMRIAATEEAEKEGAQVLDAGFTMDGLPVLAVGKMAKDEKGEAGFRYECDRGPLRFTFRVRSLAGELPVNDLGALAKSVRWFNPEGVGKGEVSWPDQPALLLGGEVAVRLPAGFQQDKITREFDGAHQWVGMLNLGNGQSEAMINFKLLSLRLHKPSGMDMTKPPPADFRKALGASFERAINARLPVDTFPLGAPRRGAMTEMAEGVTTDGHKMHCRAARLYDENHMLHVHAVVITDDPEAVRKWDKITERIITSITFPAAEAAPGGGAAPAGR